jgi:hypothetical protein
VGFANEFGHCPVSLANPSQLQHMLQLRQPPGNHDRQVFQCGNTLKFVGLEMLTLSALDLGNPQSFVICPLIGDGLP